ncbi:response regulator [Propionivibrio dicarboxylicus]|uniref:DNA-binding response regulator, OmpR family, contains REC and winged-helix (WHTH) domain n=1 Tax=Propionivibrio dicarboxylicus TaxID=83767 RepID=A0A1G8JG49_9RHOO|nr:response regulator transcription factor [Propionivibrio dicarboxylicus]SDI30122.1 DNA-binding response regulator, OmpR family, contains REC and winged-helix (wHTH) domain [Propionivibrio dicarboxylicus]
MRLLLVEDDLELANGLVNALAQSNYAADAVHFGNDAITACLTTTYRLIILDLGLPDEDGISVLRRLRANGVTAPVLILTARDDLKDRIAGLDAGGDDYLTKPFEFGELEARLRALLRRSHVDQNLRVFGEVEFDPGSRIASVKGRELDLTAREVAVLELLLARPGRVVSKQTMVESLYSWDQEANPSAIEVFVSRLRRKLDDAGAGVGVRVLRGLGYRLELQHDA